MVLGLLYAFRSRDPSPTATSRLVKKVYGQATSSGGYTYRRRGFLDDVPHKRLIRGVVLIRARDGPRLSRLLRGLECEFHVRQVVLTPADAKALGP